MSLTGCGSEDNTSDNNTDEMIESMLDEGIEIEKIASVTGASQEEIEEIQKNTSSTYPWIPTGNKVIKEPYQHVIYETFYYQNSYKGEIPNIDGYAYVGSESIALNYSKYNPTDAIKYNYVNMVAVEVEEYKNVNDESVIGYPFAGTPLDLEKAEDAPKALVR